MKRLICAVAAIAAAGTLAFADDAATAATAAKPIGTFTAWNEGIVKFYDKEDGSDATTGWGPAWDKATGIDQEWTFGYAGANYGFSGTLEFGMDNLGNTGAYSSASTTFTTPSVSWFNTYYKFGKYLELQVGKLSVSDYRNNGTIIEGGWGKQIAGSEFGPLVQVTPIDNLSLGVFLDMGSDGFAASDYLAHLNFGASYSLPELFTATAQYRNVDNYVDAGLTLTALKPVTIKLGAQSTTTDFYNDLIVSASAGGSFVENLKTNVDVKYANPAAGDFGVEAQGEYAIGSYAVGARVGYENVSGGAGTLLWGNADGLDSTGGLEVYPYAVANFDNGSYVRLGFIYTTGIAADSSLFEVPLVYVWAF